MTTFGDLFTPRQLVALTTFSDLVQEARERVKRDALAAGLPDDGKPLAAGGTGATAYADAVGVYLAFALISKSQTTGQLDLRRGIRATSNVAARFARQAIPMTWDFAEVKSVLRRTWQSGNLRAMEWVEESFDALVPATAGQAASKQMPQTQVVSAQTRSSPPIHPTTTTSATPICRTSSTSGCAAR